MSFQALNRRNGYVCISQFLLQHLTVWYHSRIKDNPCQQDKHVSRNHKCPNQTWPALLVDLAKNWKGLGKGEEFERVFSKICLFFPVFSKNSRHNNRSCHIQNLSADQKNSKLCALFNRTQNGRKKHFNVEHHQRQGYAQTDDMRYAIQGGTNGRCVSAPVLRQLAARLQHNGLVEVWKWIR